MIIDSNEETRKAVARFLKDFKSVASIQKPYVIPREKNRDVLIHLGLTLTDQWHILLALTEEDYVSGPEQDRDRAGDVWIFGVSVQMVEVYIKIKLAEYTPIDSKELVRKAVCISFHFQTLL